MNSLLDPTDGLKTTLREAINSSNPGDLILEGFFQTFFSINSADAAGGALSLVVGGTITLHNTIVANSTGGGCDGTISADSSNMAAAILADKN